MVSIAVQAGGRSSRMGHDKALLPVAGKRLIEHVLGQVEGLSDDLFVTTNHPKPLVDLELRLVPDDVPGQGALHGLMTALRNARHDNVLVLACDMPFLERGLIEYLLSLAGQADVIIPLVDEEFEPMLAIYRASVCLPAIERALADGGRRMISFFNDVNVHAVETEIVDRLDSARRSFFNINTPEDALKAEQLYSELHPGAGVPQPGQNHEHPKRG